MDKNVGSVNLDELRAARESLDRERGIETDPNMYNDYDPEKHKAEKEQEKLARENGDSASYDSAAENSEPATDIGSNDSDINYSENTVSEPSTVSSVEPVFDRSSDEVSVESTEKFSSDDDEIIISNDNDEKPVEAAPSISSAFEMAPKKEEPVQSQTNFEVYDNFADFEVNSEKKIYNDMPQIEPVQTAVLEPVQEAVSSEPTALDVSATVQNEAVSTEDEDEDALESSIDDFLNELDQILTTEEASDSDDLQITSNDTENSVSVGAGIEEDNFDEFLKDLDAQLSSDATTLDELKPEPEAVEPVVEDVQTHESEPIVENTKSSLLSAFDLEDDKTEEPSITTIEAPADIVQETTVQDEIKTDSFDDLMADLNSETNLITEESSQEETSVQDDLLDDFSTLVDSVEDAEDEDSILTASASDLIGAEEVLNKQEEIIDRPLSAEEKLERFKLDEVETEYVDTTSNSSDLEFLTDLSSLGKIQEEVEVENAKLQEQLLEEQARKEAELKAAEEAAAAIEEVEIEPEEPTVGAYQKIEPFKFIDVISTEEFKDQDKLSYVLGKDSEGEIVYSNLRDTCGTVMFTKNEDVVFNSFSSILLSLLLKNTADDIQFVICDAMFDSEFDVFNDSSYMYYNRVAKNNREIVDSLVGLSKELEERYNNLVYSGVKSISAYNLQAEERGMKPMPYLVLFMNNYAKMVQFLDSDRINVCLHNILKFGRLVGIYAVVASASDIERSDINYNLPTRICFKSADIDDSISAVGREGAEQLIDEEDFLYSTIYDEEVKHLRVADITRAEIELVIENLEV